MSQTKSKSLGTVLVVGGCGFVGSALVNQLLNFPFETPSSLSGSLPASDFPTLKSRYPTYDPSSTTVHALDLRCTNNLYDGCTYHEADITSIEQLMTVFRKVKPDVVINTASPGFEAPHAILKKVNIDGTRTLVEVAGGKHGNWGGRCKVFTHTSSSSVISDTQSDLKNADERWPYICPNPRELYSETKVYAERIVLESNDKEELGHMLTCCVRPAGIVGEGDRAGLSYSVLKTASVSALWQLHLQLGDNSNLFDCTYVHNVVYGLLCATEALLLTESRKSKGQADVLDSERVDGEAFIVTNDEPIYFWDTTRFLWRAYGREVETSKVWALPEGFATAIGAISEAAAMVTGKKSRVTRQTVRYSCMHRYFSCEKLKRRTGYRPLVSLDEGFRRCATWFKIEEEHETNRKAQ